MKKIILSFGILFLIVMIVGCSKSKNGSNATVSPTPTTKPLVTLPATQITDTPNKVDNTDTNEEKYTIQDYFPFLADHEYIYEGTGNEYASYRTVTDFIDTKRNRIQLRSNNGGTETVEVLEIKDGKLSVIKKVNECYYRDNFMDTAASTDQDEILLMEPLVKGTAWKLSDGRSRSITAADKSITVPSGTYKAIEVTTQEKDGRTKDYYAQGVGLVKTVYTAAGNDISSSLSKIKKNTPFTQTLEVYYPTSDEKIHTEQKTLTFHTGDITRMIIQKTLQEEAAEKTRQPLMSVNTKINSLYLGKDGIVYVDFSPELVSEMNAGAGFEALILQSITNTLGGYYGADRVYITINQKPYESGHILMKKGETFRVDMHQVVR